ncbi:MAG TPA: hypothetical protein VFS15_07630, partial [Kofleriaceae bacterium]|nr:hypothetical protein [Kofleriaceae bacterium]
MAITVRARDEIVERVRRALADVPSGEQPEDVEVPRAYLRSEPGDPVELFAERVSEYKTTVLRAEPDGVAAAIGTRCRLRGVTRLAVPPDLPEAWWPEAVELLPEPDLEILDDVAGALTGCAHAIAATGTIVFDGGPRQGSRR